VAASRVIVRVVQVGAAVVVLALAVAAAGFGWTAYQVRGLSSDIKTAQSHLPPTVEQQLPADSGMLKQPQVTLVRYTSDLARGATVLISTVPDRNLIGFLSLTPGIQVGSTPLRDLSTSQAITAFRGVGVPVTHVALVNPRNVAPLVDSVGGITIFNATSFSATEAGGRVVRFPHGTLKMGGADAALYVRASTTSERLESASTAVLVGIVHAALAPSGFTQVRAIGHGLASATATDLSTADVLGLVALRLRGGQAVECRLTTPGSLTGPQTHFAVSQILGRTTTVVAPCSAEKLAAAAVVPPQAVVEAAQHYGWQLFAGIGLLLACLAIIGGALLARYWPSLPPRADEARRPART